MPGREQRGRRVITLSSGEAGTVQWLVLEVADGPNQPPFFLGEPLTEAVFGRIMDDPVLVRDPEEEPTQLTLIEGPAGLVIDNGRLRWFPDFEGTARVHLQVSDPHGATTERSHTIRVRANQAPRFLTRPTTAARIGTRYQYNFLAEDPDGDDVAFRLLEGPAGMSLSRTALTWTPERGPGRNL